MKINIFWGDLTIISSTKEPLSFTSRVNKLMFRRFSRTTLLTSDDSKRASWICHCRTSARLFDCTYHLCAAWTSKEMREERHPRVLDSYGRPSGISLTIFAKTVENLNMKVMNGEYFLKLYECFFRIRWSFHVFFSYDKIRVHSFWAGLTFYCLILSK